MGRFAALATAAFAALATGPASAKAPASARLVYERSEGAEACPGAGGLRDAVAVRLGYDPFDAGAAASVEVSLSRRGPKIVGRVRLVNPHGIVLGDREVAGRVRACAEVVSALALAVSLALDPDAAGRPRRPRREPDRETSDRREMRAIEASPAPAPLVRELPFETVPDRSPVSATLALLGTLTAGAAPGPAAGFAAGGRLRRGRGSLGLEHRHEPAAGTREARSSRDVFLLSPCYDAGGFGACLLAAAGRVLAEGVEVASPRRGSFPWLAGGARLLGRFGSDGGPRLVVQADLEVPVVRARFLVGEGVRWRTPWVAASVAAGLEIDLPGGSR